MAKEHALEHSAGVKDQESSASDECVDPGRGIKAGLLALLLIAAIVVGCCLAPKGFNLAITIASLVLLVILLGYNVCDRQYLGILIDERNQMSLSRLQLLLWTIVVLSAYITIALERVFARAPDPLAVDIPYQLWLLMGISMGSVVGSTFIRQRKKQRIVDPEEGLGEAEKRSLGLSYHADSRTEARFTDIFRGDEVIDHAYIDMAKLQMLLVTLIAIAAYTVRLFHMVVVEDVATITSFPTVPDGFLAIFGISHAGYLGEKAIDTAKTLPRKQAEQVREQTSRSP